MNEDSRIYVAGHRGLVGSSIVRHLKSHGYKRIILDEIGSLDLRYQNSTRNFISLHEPEYVFLAAAKVGGINYNKSRPAEFIYDNLAIQNNLINASYDLGVKKLLFLGSSCIYPKVCPQPIKEEDLLSSFLEPTNEAYAIAKIAGLKMCEMYTKQYGFQTVSAMPANIYGPNDNFKPEQSHVIPAMITKFIDAVNNGEKDVVFFGDGSPIRDFMYVDDLADACVFLMNNYDNPEHINVGSGIDVSIKDLANTIAGIVGYKGNISWDTTKPNGSPRRTLDISRMDSLGWYPKTSLEEGLVKTIDWYKKTGGIREL